MTRVMRCTLLALVFATTGCDQGGSGRTDSATAVVIEQVPDPLVLRSRQLAFRFQNALARLEEPMPPTTRFEQRACPDSEILEDSPNQMARTLVLSTHDSRYSAHSLMPLSLTDPLRTENDLGLETFFEDATGNASSALGRLLKSQDHARAAEDEARALEARNYKGVFHITQFKKAHLIRKKNQRRREWTKGVMSAWLAIYDIDTSENLCQTQLLSVNDVEGEPTSIRLRPETQRRLVRELGQQMRSQAETALASISRVLNLPRQANHVGPPRVAELAQPPGKQ